MPALEVEAPTTTAAAKAVSQMHLKNTRHSEELMEASLRLCIPLELKILSALVMLFLFLLFLIVVLWDRYGKEIGELYTSPTGSKAQRQNTNDVKVHDVADEFSIYQKLPTFFYEYMPRRKKQD